MKIRRKRRQAALRRPLCYKKDEGAEAELARGFHSRHTARWMRGETKTRVGRPGMRSHHHPSIDRIAIGPRPDAADSHHPPSAPQGVAVAGQDSRGLAKPRRRQAILPVRGLGKTRQPHKLILPSRTGIWVLYTSKGVASQRGSRPAGLRAAEAVKDSSSSRGTLTEGRFLLPFPANLTC